MHAHDSPLLDVPSNRVMRMGLLRTGDEHVDSPSSPWRFSLFCSRLFCSRLSADFARISMPFLCPMIAASVSPYMVGC